MKTILISFAIFLSTIGSCDSGWVGKTTGEKFTVGEDLVITQTQSECFVRCPVYKVTVKGDGTVAFEGGKNTSGNGETKISPDEVKRLLHEANEIDFLSLENRYDPQTCPNYATDQSTITISITSGGRSKTISHYLGCSDKDDGLKPHPPGLSEFEQQVVEVTGIKKWFEFK